MMQADIQTKSTVATEQDILFIWICQIFKMEVFRGAELVSVNVLSWKKIIKKMFLKQNFVLTHPPFFSLNFQFVKMINIFSK